MTTSLIHFSDWLLGDWKYWAGMGGALVWMSVKEIRAEVRVRRLVKGRREKRGEEQ